MGMKIKSTNPAECCTRKINSCFKKLLSGKQEIPLSRKQAKWQRNTPTRKVVRLDYDEFWGCWQYCRWRLKPWRQNKYLCHKQPLPPTRPRGEFYPWAALAAEPAASPATDTSCLGVRKFLLKSSNTPHRLLLSSRYQKNKISFGNQSFFRQYSPDWSPLPEIAPLVVQLFSTLLSKRGLLLGQKLDSPASKAAVVTTTQPMVRLNNVKNYPECNTKGL